MSATSAPFGLRPAFHPSGLDRAQALAGGIVSAYSSNIFKGQPVQYGTTANSGTLGTIIPAGATGAWVGAFAGVEWTDTTGRARVSNFWPANTAYTAGTCTAYFYNDSNIVYEIQADATIAQTSIGNEYNFSSVTGGSTTTGLSTCTLGVSTAVGNGVQGQMRVVGLAPYVDNAWGDAFPIVRVVVANSQFFGAFTAIA
ncbi:hypothetical protein UFOVP239_73 [uncultured Caudovirales phage]|uniref:Uncharacterized protein n=1 Tax=uncultured Caudovirales phage TaxID=2100421 RepID=A0A6J7WQH7_9CAUD|nr:hypothetical protein UFOVP239_73 [uncultured Caudovirales phage]